MSQLNFISKELNGYFVENLVPNHPQELNLNRLFPEKLMPIVLYGR
jgi:hypothetical protein